MEAENYRRHSTTGNSGWYPGKYLRRQTGVRSTSKDDTDEDHHHDDETPVSLAVNYSILLIPVVAAALLTPAVLPALDHPLFGLALVDGQDAAAFAVLFVDADNALGVGPDPADQR